MGGVRRRFVRGETVTIHPYVACGEDIYGKTAVGLWDALARPGCAVAPRVEVEEVGNNRSMIVNGFEVYDTYDTPVGPHDELTVRGIRCKVDGEIARWRNPFTGRQFGAVITVRRVDG